MPGSLFSTMAKAPLPWAIILPSILITILAIGWTRDEIIEEQVYNIWSPKRSTSAKDLEYQNSVGKLASVASNFLGMAISRDDGNLLTESRLDEIRDRMMKIEATKVDYKGVTYTYEDICLFNGVGLGTSYKMPCIRLSPMDWFQEARWYFDSEDEEYRVTWYNEIIRKALVRPRVKRFGIMNDLCASPNSESGPMPCDHLIALRTDATYAVENGFPESYANPILLLSDVGELEMNDECKICIETNFESTAETLTKTITATFQIMLSELTKAAELGTVGAPFRLLIAQIEEVVESIDRAAVEEWYSYYVIRGLYAELGAADYMNLYASSAQLLALPCSLANPGNAAACQASVTLEEAQQQLLNHADNVFSSVSTAGAPFPFWSDGDGSGYLFEGTEPVGGSGIDMSGTVLSAAEYFDVANFGSFRWRPTFGPLNSPDPSSSDWAALVETDPLYRWFIGGVTPMTAHCGNGNLTGTNIPGNPLGTNDLTAIGLADFSQQWCTEHNTPSGEDDTFTQQHFAKMFFDLLVDSGPFLGVVQGEDDPYTYTLGTGCFYSLGGSRALYRNATESTILYEASRPLYNIDEGASSGVVDAHLFVGGAVPGVGDYSYDYPLQTIRVIQTIYPMNVAASIMARMKNCNRPGGPVEVQSEDAKAALKLFKEAMEMAWTEGWQDADAGEVQFVGFTDDQGVIGSAGRLLQDLTLDNGKLTTISIILIVVFSAIFLFSFDVVASRVLVTFIGVALVVISFFSAIGLGILFGIKVNVNIAWTLPFIILGLGVDDMYIVLLSLRSKKDYSERSFVEAMKEVVIPVSMTSLVNACMFAVMNIVDIPAVALTAQVALISVIFLYLTIVFCYPAYCYIDMKRQADNRYDVAFCLKKSDDDDHQTVNDTDEEKGNFLFTHVYEKLVLGSGTVSVATKAVILLTTAALIGVGAYGTTQRSVGLGLQDFFPSFNPAQAWAEETTESVAAWAIEIKWGAENYTDPDTQLYITRQFERVIETRHVAQVDTHRLWLAAFSVWTTRQCTANFDREDPDILECGMDQIFPGDNSTCSGFWAPNKYDAREKNFGDGSSCQLYQGGVCRPTEEMHPRDLLDAGIDPDNLGETAGLSWCPVFGSFTEEKFQFCLMKWSNYTGGGGDFVRDDDLRTPYEQCEGDFYSDGKIEVPLVFSRGPGFFAFDLLTNEDYVDLIKDCNGVCVNDDRVHCWMGGIPFVYWEQYLTIEKVLLQASAAAISVGFGVAFLFLFIMLKNEGKHPTGRIALGSFLGGILIAATTLISLISVVGISVLAGVNLTAFSAMSFLLSVGFSIEYSVHVLNRFMRAPLELDSPVDRVRYAMSFLTLPTFMSFVSSTIGVVCLAFTDFDFNNTFFFKPLITVMFVCYFVGCWSLPVVLTMLNFDALKVGSGSEIEVPGIVSIPETATETLPTQEEKKPVEPENSSYVMVGDIWNSQIDPEESSDSDDAE